MKALFVFFAVIAALGLVIFASDSVELGGIEGVGIFAPIEGDGIVSAGVGLDSLGVGVSLEAEEGGGDSRGGSGMEMDFDLPFDFVETSW